MRTFIYYVYKVSKPKSGGIDRTLNVLEIVNNTPTQLLDVKFNTGVSRGEVNEVMCALAKEGHIEKLDHYRENNQFRIIGI
ncbi:MAG: hypothetical protein WC455_26730 [Dehalococcoidia bacterium]|jgi:DNA-binding IclR family transcriptional regulator